MHRLARHRGNRAHTDRDTTNGSSRPARRLSLWYGGAIVALMPTITFLVISTVYAIIGATRGPLTRTSAAALEAGTAPTSRWIELSGIADTRDSIELTYSSRAGPVHDWYVPVIAPGREPAGHTTVVFLYVGDRHRRDFSKTMLTFSGTVSLSSLPNQAKAFFSKRGLQVDPHYLLVNFGDTPGESFNDAKQLGWTAAGFAAVALICFAIGRSRSKRAASA